MSRTTGQDFFGALKTMLLLYTVLTKPNRNVRSEAGQNKKSQQCLKINLQSTGYQHSHISHVQFICNTNSSLSVDFQCRIIFTCMCVKFTFVNKIEAMHERLLVSVKVEPHSTSRFRSALFIFPLFHLHD